MINIVKKIGHLDINKFRLLITLVVFIAMLITSAGKNTYAVDCDYDKFKEGDPYITEITCPIVQTINVLVGAAGVMFAIYVVFAAYKYYTSLGDPKAAMGAQQTLTTAIMGFLAIVGVFTILYILATLFGFDASFTEPFDPIQEAFEDILDIRDCSLFSGTCTPIVER